MESHQPVRILTVCTGNTCRSPVAERLLQAGLERLQAGGFEVRSAGTRALAGSPLQPLSAEIIRLNGGMPDGFAARQLTPEILGNADLVLTMASGHSRKVLQLDASLLDRMFTIREFARLLADLEERGEASPSGSDFTQRWRELPARASSIRHLVLAAEASDNDVDDPYQRGPEAYGRMEDELVPAVLAILRYARLSTQRS